jgi:hypothetical protein
MAHGGIAMATAEDSAKERLVLVAHPGARALAVLVEALLHSPEDLGIDDAGELGLCDVALVVHLADVGHVLEQFVEG